MYIPEKCLCLLIVAITTIVSEKEVKLYVDEP